MSKQPNALELADTIEARYGFPTPVSQELRRLHEANAMLVESLWAMLSEGADHGIYEDNPAYIQAIEALAKAQGENNG